MPVECTLRDRVLALSVSGVVSNHEIETALAAALAGAQPRTGVRLLWDARKTETPLTADDMAWRFALVSSFAKRDVISRGALLVRDAPSSLLEVSRTELRRALRDFECDVFTDDSEARCWLNA